MSTTPMTEAFIDRGAALLKAQYEAKQAGSDIFVDPEDAGIVYVGGKPMMVDPDGGYRPVEKVKPVDRLTDQAVRKMIGHARNLSEQIARWGDVGMDQLVFGLPIEGLHREEILQTLELFGDKVIPEFDKDRKHSTDYYREQAQPKYGPFSKPLPEGVNWPTLLPTGALKPLD